MENDHRDNARSPRPNDPRVTRLETRLQEVFDGLWDGFVDPDDALYDADGTRWRMLGTTQTAGAPAAVPYRTESDLAEIRLQCRALAASNEFAINGHENRISYIVGTGHVYRATAKAGHAPPAAMRRQVQAAIDEFVLANHWHKRQQEIVRRKDRDGECFLRLFVLADGGLRVRFVEPEQVAVPPQRAADPAASFGIQTEPEDAETVEGYWIDGQWTGAAEIQHRKSNVDANVKRGLPLFYPVRKNLQRAERLLRNMSAVAEIQSAIALIRRHMATCAPDLEQLARSHADYTATHPTTGRTSLFRRYGPGTILDTFGATQYEFPAAGIDASRYVAVLQAELRAIASRLVMPEFMLSSDASNANYASTMVAEGPAVKMFQRLQHEMLEDDLDLMRRVVRQAVEVGRLPPEALAEVEVRGTPPSLAVRDRLRDAQADQILLRAGALSVQTMAARHGLDPEQEVGE